MSKVKGMLEESMMRNPELYNGHADYEFWIQCRKEELLEKQNKPTKRRSNVRRKKEG